MPGGRVLESADWLVILIVGWAAFYPMGQGRERDHTRYKIPYEQFYYEH
jgi:hypothetical protein